MRFSVLIELAGAGRACVPSARRFVGLRDLDKRGICEVPRRSRPTAESTRTPAPFTGAGDTGSNTVGIASHVEKDRSSGDRGGGGRVWWKGPEADGADVDGGGRGASGGGE